MILYHIFGYRKQVVLQNLRNSFPDKTEQEINDLCRSFYHYFCDLLLETFKTLTVSKETMLQHCSMSPASAQLMKELAIAHKSTILVMGHMGNWEWGGNTFSLTCQQQLYVIYHPLQNKYFDGLTYRMRSRFGSKLIPMKDTFRQMLAHRHEVTTTAFIADQTPFPENAYWTTFLHQQTPVYKGTEVLAKKLNYPIVYTYIKRVKRGYYEMYVEMLCADPSATKEGEITEMHTRRLEKDIIADPATWLWSHKRWKHKKTA
jgi:KDO2-lipid IV(A) lauroyltransferase